MIGSAALYSELEDIFLIGLCVGQTLPIPHNCTALLFLVWWDVFHIHLKEVFSTGLCGDQSLL